MLANTIFELYATNTTTTVYKKIHVALKVSQTLAVLEVVHAVLRLVRSSPVTTFIQVSMYAISGDDVSFKYMI